MKLFALKFIHKNTYLSINKSCGFSLKAPIILSILYVIKSPPKQNYFQGIVINHVFMCQLFTVSVLIKDSAIVEGQ